MLVQRAVHGSLWSEGRSALATLYEKGFVGGQKLGLAGGVGFGE